MNNLRAYVKGLTFSAAVTVFSIVALQFIMPSNVSAAVALNPDPGGMIVSGQREMLRNCDTLFSTSPAYAYFFTQPGTSHLDMGTFEVGPTTPSVSIRMNWASAVCRNNSAVNITTLQALPTTPGVSGLAPGFAHDYTSGGGPGNYNIPGTFRHSFSEFSYAPPGGFTTSGSYTVNIDLYRISQFRSGNLLCVNPGSRTPVNLLDFGACSRLTLTATFWVNVRNQPAPTLDPVRNTCTGIIVGTNGSEVHIYGPGGGLGSVRGPSGEFRLEGLVSPRTTLDIYGIGDGVTNFGNTHRQHVWVPPPDCRYDFAATPTAVLDLTTKEDPSSANFSSVATLARGPSGVKGVTVRHHYYLVRRGAEVLIDDTTRVVTLTSAGDRHQRANIDLRSYGLTAGDQVCSTVTVRPAGGVANADGDIISIRAAEQTDRRCTMIVNLPYVSFYGGDVSVGGDFANRPNCSSGAAQNINTNMNLQNLGSGVEFAAFVTGTIGGFRTAKVTHASPINRLAFANTAPNFGNFGAASCIKDYFSDAEAFLSPNTGANPVIDVAGLTTDNLYYRPSTGPVRLRGNIADGVRAGIYIKGDLIIDGPISYQNTAWLDVQSIPSLHVYVSGNIFISRNVSNIAGMFVAQPDTTRPNTGRIVTCAEGSAAVAVNQLFANCATKLTVRGALIANQIDFLRTSGSLRDASADGERNASSSRGAEVIELAPELLMSAPDAVNEARTKKYQYFTTLPPIL